MRKLIIACLLCVLLCITSCGGEAVQQKDKYNVLVQSRSYGREARTVNYAFGDSIYYLYNYLIEDQVSDIYFYILTLDESGEWEKTLIRKCSDIPPKSAFAYDIACEDGIVYIGVPGENSEKMSGPVLVDQLYDKDVFYQCLHQSNIVETKRGEIIPLDIYWRDDRIPYSLVEKHFEEKTNYKGLEVVVCNIEQLYCNPHKLKELNMEPFALAVEFR
ncbi:MAG: hypothetical protein U0K95_00795 [Eubacterium sp.]|nr:hypothetical protein [Eubacterium sp.]